MTVAISPLTDDQSAGVGMSNAALREDTRRIIRSTPFVKPEGNSFIDAAGAALWRENTALSLLHEITDGDEARPLEEVRGYNPYSALKAQFDADTLARLAPEISKGDFDLVRSDAQLRGTVADILNEKDKLAAMEGMSTAQIMQAAGPGLLAWGVVNAVVSALQLAVLYAPFSAAYRDIKGLPHEG